MAACPELFWHLRNIVQELVTKGWNKEVLEVADAMVGGKEAEEEVEEQDPERWAKLKDKVKRSRTSGDLFAIVGEAIQAAPKMEPFWVDKAKKSIQEVLASYQALEPTERMKEWLGRDEEGVAKVERVGLVQLLEHFLEFKPAPFFFKILMHGDYTIKKLREKMSSVIESCKKVSNLFSSGSLSIATALTF
jgi:hypothetical protein